MDLFLYFLLALIAIGALLASPVGTEILKFLLILGAIIVGAYFGFYIILFLYAVGSDLFSYLSELDKKISDAGIYSTIGDIIGVILVWVFLLSGMYTFYESIKTKQLTFKKFHHNPKNTLQENAFGIISIIFFLWLAYMWVPYIINWLVT